MADTELFKNRSEAVKVCLVISLRSRHRQDFVHPAPVEQEGEGCPSTSSGDDLRRYSCKQQLDSAANTEAVAQYVGEHGRRPDFSDEVEKFMFEEIFGLASG